MKYKISVTSCIDKPCKKAYVSEFIYEHMETCTEYEFNTRYSERKGMWGSKGFSHTTTKDGDICRLESKEGWVIDIDSLEDLNKFSKEHGEIIISVGNYGGTPTIEVYDCYRE